MLAFTPLSFCTTRKADMRLDRFICKSTDLTKHDATLLINRGEVFVNGNVVTDEASQVHEKNRITLNGKPLKTRPFRYILIHKPPTLSVPILMRPIRRYSTI